MHALKKIRKCLQDSACPIKAMSLQRFFKDRGKGDKFLGITVPEQRQLAKTHRELSDNDLKILLASPLHEERLTALLILVLQYEKADALRQKQIYNFYFANVTGINNWDLVDLSAPYIVGLYLLDKDKKFLHKLITAKNLWKRRIAIVTTWQFIRNNDFKETLALAEKTLLDKEDLIHKATGWMLREVGKRDFATLDNFLRKHYQNMPRTMLRYAIEKYPEKLRLAYLHSKV
ncbi:DNA alkylation repair enzyme [Gammaproteobacteria bacterium]